MATYIEQTREAFDIEQEQQRQNAICRLVTLALDETGNDREAAFSLLMRASEKAGSMAVAHWSNKAAGSLD